MTAAERHRGVSWMTQGSKNAGEIFARRCERSSAMTKTTSEHELSPPPSWV